MFKKTFALISHHVALRNLNLSSLILNLRMSKHFLESFFESAEIFGENYKLF